MRLAQQASTAHQETVRTADRSGEQLPGRVTAEILAANGLGAGMSSRIAVQSQQLRWIRNQWGSTGSGRRRPANPPSPERLTSPGRVPRPGHARAPGVEGHLGAAAGWSAQRRPPRRRRTAHPPLRSPIGPPGSPDGLRRGSAGVRRLRWSLPTRDLEACARGYRRPALRCVPQNRLGAAHGAWAS